MVGMSSNEFELTDQHLKLVRRFYFEWQNCETGAPAVNPKRPFGNSYVPPDIAEILGWDWPDEDDLSGTAYDRESDAMAERCMAVYRETQTAMSIIALRAGKASEVGVYVNTAPKYHRPVWVWARAGDPA